MSTSPQEPSVLGRGRDFPWAPITEAVQAVCGGFAIVCAMSICGWAVGDRLATAWLGTGISSQSLLADWPELCFFTPEVFIASLVSVLRVHQAIWFPSPRELLKAFAVPFLVWTVAFFSAVVRLSAGPPPDPYELYGEWVREDSTFHGERLAEGRAVYLSKKGFVAVVDAPPFTGRTGEASFDEESRELTFVLQDSVGPPEMMKMKVFFDRDCGRLRMESSEGVNGAYFRSYRKVPEWVKAAAW